MQNIAKSINWYPFNQQMVSNTNDKKKLGKGTKSVHSGTSPSENSLNTPVYQTSTFYLDDKGYKMWMAGEPRAPVYSGTVSYTHLTLPTTPYV